MFCLLLAKLEAPNPHPEIVFNVRVIASYLLKKGRLTGEINGAPIVDAVGAALAKVLETSPEWQRYYIENSLVELGSKEGKRIVEEAFEQALAPGQTVTDIWSAIPRVLNLLVARPELEWVERIPELGALAKGFNDHEVAGMFFKVTTIVVRSAQRQGKAESVEFLTRYLRDESAVEGDAECAQLAAETLERCAQSGD